MLREQATARDPHFAGADIVVADRRRHASDHGRRRAARPETAFGRGVVTASVTVALGSRSYEVAIGEGLLREAGARLAQLVKRGRVAVVTDRHVEATPWRGPGAVVAPMRACAPTPS